MNETGDEATGAEKGQEQTTSGLCQATTAAGGPCRSPVLKGGSFCFMHEPSATEERKEAASRGGSVTAARRALLQGQVDFSTPASVVAFIELMTRSLLLGQLPASTAEVCSKLAGEAARLRSAIDLAERLDELETAVGALGAGGDGEGSL